MAFISKDTLIVEERKAIVQVGNYSVREMPTGGWAIYRTMCEELDLNRHEPIGYFGQKDDAVEAAKHLRFNQ